MAEVHTTKYGFQFSPALPDSVQIYVTKTGKVKP